MKCDRVTAAEGISGPRMVRCQDPAKIEIRSATGTLVGNYCQRCSFVIRRYPGWIEAEI